MAEVNALAHKESKEVATPETTWGGTYYAPRVDILETDDELTFYCDLPGVRPEDLDLRFEKDELVIHGKVRPRYPEGKFWLEEYGTGDFYRAFTIYEEVDPDRISAELKRGVLVIHLPKREEVKPKRIAIRAE